MTRRQVDIRHVTQLGEAAKPRVPLAGRAAPVTREVASLIEHVSGAPVRDRFDALVREDIDPLRTVIPLVTATATALLDALIRHGAESSPSESASVSSC